MRTIDQSNYEEWIFEYYEGTLNAEEKAQVLDFVQMDSSYMEEFEAFAKTYLREPLPDKLPIESSLLRRENYFSINYVIASTLVIIVSGLLLVKKSEVKSEQVNITKHSVINELHQQGELSKEKRLPVQRLNYSNPTVKRVEPFVQFGINNEHIIISDTNHTSLPNVVRDLKEVQEVPKVNAYDSLSGEKATTTIAPEKITDKDAITAPKSRLERKAEKRKLKQIAKAKEKQRREREAQKLMKGNMPYVVPLDPNTF
ncbi:MAG: hypothetical protein J7604_21265 [Sporocytophaga sp.]|uniref:hypothetical protein n=1 Tax=Sporocytophaga sp. TaxID=2231183 RepID=UPI001B18ECAD|nr:hypothetical protein [Sporocytophaga sp.]MBO9702756.1 hypothetical protein [Sporocytophaga sp.]